MKIYTILVSVPESKTALRLAPDGTLTRRKIHAAKVEGRARAEEIARSINEGPKNIEAGITARVREF